MYAYAFTHCGAVQCGFCTPGMVMSAKGLIDANPNPTRDEVKFALRNNICRCTGYKKIEDAVLLAAKMFREGTQAPHETFTGKIGENLPRVDAPAKAIGTAEYTDDIRMEGMLFGGAVRSDYPRAIIKGIDISEALEVPGVVKIVTAADLPGQLKVGHLKRDQWVLVPIGGEVHFCGDPIVLIAAAQACPHPGGGHGPRCSRASGGRQLLRPRASGPGRRGGQAEKQQVCGHHQVPHAPH